MRRFCNVFETRNFTIINDVCEKDKKKEKQNSQRDQKHKEKGEKRNEKGKRQTNKEKIGQIILEEEHEKREINIERKHEREDNNK